MMIFSLEVLQIFKGLEAELVGTEVESETPLTLSQTLPQTFVMVGLKVELSFLSLKGVIPFLRIPTH